MRLVELHERYEAGVVVVCVNMDQVVCFRPRMEGEQGAVAPRGTLLWFTDGKLPMKVTESYAEVWEKA